MNPIFRAALEIQDVCFQRNWRFCFFGALAVQRWLDEALILTELKPLLKLKKEPRIEKRLKTLLKNA